MALNNGSLKAIRYPPERLVDAVFTQIAAGAPIPNPVPLSLSGLQASNLVARFVHLATSQVAGVRVQLRVDDFTVPPLYNMQTAQLAQQVPDETALTITDSASLNYLNGGTLQTDYYPASYGLWAWNPTTADKLALKIPLNTDDMRRRAKLPTGWVPQITPDALLRSEYARPQVWVTSGTVNVQAGGNIQAQLAQGTPAPGHFHAILGIAVDASLGGTLTTAQQAANALQVLTDRDSDLAVLSYPAAGVPYRAVLGAPGGTDVFSPKFGEAAPFIVSRANWQVYLLGTQAVNAVPFRVVAADFVEFETHRIRWGLSTTTDQDLIDEVLAGAY